MESNFEDLINSSHHSQETNNNESAATPEPFAAYQKPISKMSLEEVEHELSLLARKGGLDKFDHDQKIKLLEKKESLS